MPKFEVFDTRKCEHCMFASGPRYSTTTMQNKMVYASIGVPKRKGEYHIVLLDGMCKHSHRKNSVSVG